MIAENNCDIRIYNPDFEWIAAVHAAESIQFSRELYGAGKFEIHVRLDKPGAEMLTVRGNIIVIGRNGRKSGIIRDFKIIENNRSTTVIAYGETGASLAKQRIIVPPTEVQVPNALGYDKIQGAAESVIKHYAKMHMGAPYDYKRCFERLFILNDLERGDIFPWKASYSNLHDELYKIAQYGEIGWEIYADTKNKQWIFDCIVGTNRTKTQKDCSPVTFQMEYQNISEYSYSEDSQKYCNTGYAGGQGEDEKRQLYVIGAENIGFQRHEIFLDCPGADDMTELQYYGNQKLSEYELIKSLELSALPNVFTFEKDYFLGDKVTVLLSNTNINEDCVVTNVREIWERHTGYRCEMRLGKKLPNLFNIIN